MGKFKNFLKSLLAFILFIVFFIMLLIGLNYIVYIGLFKEYSVWEYIRSAFALTVIAFLFFFTFWGVGLFLATRVIKYVTNDIKKTKEDEILKNIIEKTKEKKTE